MSAPRGPAPIKGVGSRNWAESSNLSSVTAMNSALGVLQEKPQHFFGRRRTGRVGKAAARLTACPGMPRTLYFPMLAH